MTMVTAMLSGRHHRHQAVALAANTRVATGCVGCERQEEVNFRQRRRKW